MYSLANIPLNRGVEKLTLRLSQELILGASTTISCVGSGEMYRKRWISFLLKVERKMDLNTKWLARLQKWQLKTQQMMRGRYGRYDQLNKALVILSLISLLLGMFISGGVLRVLALLLLGLTYYRFFSKKIYVRANENTKFMRFWRPIAGKLNLLKRSVTDRQYRYFQCPACHQTIRAPRGKGNIRVTCQSCHHQFVKKV